jgi:hypothetical protein
VLPVRRPSQVHRPDQWTGPGNDLAARFGRDAAPLSGSVGSARRRNGPGQPGRPGLFHRAGSASAMPPRTCWMAARPRVTCWPTRDSTAHPFAESQLLR